MDPRLSRLNEPHVAPITAFINRMRARELDVPNIDPDDGGIGARALFFLTTPGPEAIRSRFVSCKNPDATARNIGNEWHNARLARKDVILWNVAPQCIGRNPTGVEIRDAAPVTQAFIDLLPNLLVIIFCGPTHTQKTIPFLRISPTIEVLRTYHTAQRSFHGTMRDDVREKFREVAQLLAT